MEVTKTTGYSRKVQASRFEPIEVVGHVEVVFDGDESEEEIEEAMEEEFWKTRENVERRLAEVLTELKKGEQ